MIGFHFKGDDVGARRRCFGRTSKFLHDFEVSVDGVTPTTTTTTTTTTTSEQTMGCGSPLDERIEEETACHGEVSCEREESSKGERECSGLMNLDLDPDPDPLQGQGEEDHITTIAVAVRGSGAAMVDERMEVVETGCHDGLLVCDRGDAMIPPRTWDNILFGEIHRGAESTIRCCTSRVWRV
mmetsp:Transcript_39525/g.64084  ORF Transcript_39525/g.64084 Transcript_39525/m.64084 type:complete len:183 (-) Transcript_39525:251-799(-)